MSKGRYGARVESVTVGAVFGAYTSQLSLWHWFCYWKRLRGSFVRRFYPIPKHKNRTFCPNEDTCLASAIVCDVTVRLMSLVVLLYFCVASCV